MMSKTHTQPSSVTTTTGGPSSSSSSSSPAGGTTSPANVLHVQPEKPQHYTYLKEFRTEQCPLFVQHKCTQHRPFACFHWHFLNQRRRRPIRRRDGTFNYSPDVYCTKYDEGTGTCPDGDECPFLHRTAGDTERRYHLRYYKTGSCIHETDGKGHCSKNGSHCAFAHGSHDLRCPVYDIREVQVIESQGGSGAAEGGEGEGQSGLAASTALIEKILSEEPRWQALPCPAVKHSEEWGDPSKCEGEEGCQYCHTRSEQQFHPEVRGPLDPYPSQEGCSSPGSRGGRSGSLSGGPFSPSGGLCVAEQGLLGRVLSMCGGGEPHSPWAREGGYGRAPGYEREDQAKQKSFAMEQRNREMAPAPPGPLHQGHHGAPTPGLSSGMNANALPFYPTSDTVESVVALDDLDLNDFGMSALERSLDSSSAMPRAMLGGNQLQSSAPVNIPGSLCSSAPFSSPSPSPPIRAHQSPFFSSHLSQPSQSESSFLGPSHSSLGLNGVSSSIWEHPSGQGSPGTPPALLPTMGQSVETARVRQELDDTNRLLKHWDHTWRHTAQAEEQAQRQTSFLQEALEGMRAGENPHLALHQLQLIHRLPLDPVDTVYSVTAALQSAPSVQNRPWISYPDQTSYSPADPPTLISDQPYSLTQTAQLTLTLILREPGVCTQHCTNLECILQYYTNLECVLQYYTNLECVLQYCATPGVCTQYYTNLECVLQYFTNLECVLQYYTNLECVLQYYTNMECVLQYYTNLECVLSTILT
ncbi:unnamed protein product [Coregonus sp. 'balchen']|nr:unnamed protein product [Coregonus sp. 'balchen']